MNDFEIRLPEPSGGLTWRWMESDDQDVVYNLFHLIEEVDNPPYRTTLAEINQLFAQTQHWVGIVGETEDGTPKAFLHARLRLADPFEVRCNGAVTHDYRGRGIGSIIAQFQGEAGEYLARLLPPGVPVVILCSAANHSAEWEHILEAQGYSWSYTLHEMRSDLKALPEPGTPGPLIKIEPWNPDLENLVRLAALEFAPGAVNSIGRNLEQWKANRPDFAPELSFIALDRSTDRTRVAGFLLAAKYEQDWEVLGWQEGYIDLLEVGLAWRQTDVAKELVSATMHAAKAAGLDKVATAVSSHHELAATKLFGSLGFSAGNQEREYTKKINR
ncbi:hypothetical protein BSR29_08340 [Boudabousia liubingyangii]|uniref:N-acetyltransferase domain-containing protein n=1 Tax=Boudabousia liubingyangii TaxID=1921764 RepID=A0A1Q5PJD5_9ACTO|nr:GNAT family N-acetyltransferase [Boudabousia liubingyangii]OKL45979.1 hypothetical protein BSR29_08340 [Boudabousia liubingyangii]OKL47744.1 hypothetical protein BSR28_04485 [Boudabousia liubingyangii]